MFYSWKKTVSPFLMPFLFAVSVTYLLSLGFGASLRVEDFRVQRGHFV